MKTVTKLLAATAFALTMGAASAQAAVYIGISTDGGANITQVFSQADGSFTWEGTGGGFEFISVDGDAFQLPALLHSDTVETNASGAASISIFVTRTDLEAPDYHGFYSGFTGNTQFGGNFTVGLATYYDDSNSVFGTANLIASTTFTSVGGSSANFVSGGQDLTGPFSVTHRYDISTTRGGSTSPTVTLGAIPEPGTWALMIMGFGGAGAMLRSTRRRLATAA